MSYVGNKPAQTTIPADDAVTTAMLKDDAVTSAKIDDGTIATADIADDAVTVDKVANAINTSIAANTAKVTNATHTGDVTGATALTIATDAVDIAMLSATGTADSTTFLRGDNAWVAVSGGLSDSSQWQVTTDFIASSDPTIITANLEEVDTDGYGRVGSAMTQSSGVFSFPSTGIWLIQGQAGFELNATESKYNYITIDTTVDDGTWTVAAAGSSFMNATSGYGEVFSNTSFQFDVTDVSTHKVRFKVDCQDNATTCMGNSNINETCFTFTKLGDT